MDQALVATLWWRRGRRADAHGRATALVRAKPRRQQRGQHPWTVAGVLVQCASVLAELGDVATLLLAIERTARLIHGAPIDLPLRWQWFVLLASARRQEGNLGEAAEALDHATEQLDPGTCDLGLLELERARIARAQGDLAAAAAEYDRAVATFAAAGVSHMAQSTSLSTFTATMRS